MFELHVFSIETAWSTTDYLTLKTFLTDFLGITYRGSHYIQPELSQSQLSFNDLFLDPDTGRVRLCVLIISLLRMHYHHLPSCLAGTRAGSHDVCLLLTLELQDDSHSRSRPSDPQQTRAPLCLWWNSGISTLFSHDLQSYLATQHNPKYHPVVDLQVLSNIHIVRATYNLKNPKTWSFSPQVLFVFSLLPLIEVCWNKDWDLGLT